MKAFIYSLIFTLLFLSFGLYFNSKIFNFTDEYISDISVIESYIIENDWDNASNKLNTYSKSFEDSKKLWYKFIDHQYFSDISTYLNTLDVGIRLQNAALTLEQISKIKSTLENIRENEECTLNNIF